VAPDGEGSAPGTSADASQFGTELPLDGVVLLCPAVAVPVPDLRSGGATPVRKSPVLRAGRGLGLATRFQLRPFRCMVRVRSELVPVSPTTQVLLPDVVVIALRLG